MQPTHAMLITCAILATASTGPADKGVKCLKPQEEYRCQPPCPPQTCRSLSAKYNCQAEGNECQLGCACEDGYYRNANEDCVSAEDCMRCLGVHEYFNCGSYCDNECDTLHIRNQTHCDVVNVVCNRKCYCETGYARDQNNVCVPIGQCKRPT